MAAADEPGPDEEESAGPAAPGWPALGPPVAFLLLVGGWAWYAVPGDWRAGHPWRAIAEGLVAAVALYAWLRFMLQIWRGWRAAREPPPRLPPPAP